MSYRNVLRWKTMTEEDTRYEDPDYDGLYEDLIDAPYPFKALTGGADVYVDYHQENSIGTIAHRNGFDIKDVHPFDGDEFGAKVIIKHKALARGVADKVEENHRDGEDG